MRGMAIRRYLWDNCGYENGAEIENNTASTTTNNNKMENTEKYILSQCEVDEHNFTGA